MSGVFFFEQARALSRHGHKVGLIYSENVPATSMFRPSSFFELFKLRCFSDDGINTLRMKICSPNLDTMRFQFWKQSIQILFREYTARYGKPDIVHAQSVLWAGVAAQSIRHATGIPYAVTEHGSFIALDTIKPWKREMASRAFRDANMVCAVSTDLAGQLERRYGLRKVAVVANAVDTTFFRLPPKPRRTKPFRFLSIARCVPIKNLTLLIEGFAMAFKGNNTVVLELCGDGEEKNALRRLARTTGIDRQVVFRGHLSRDEVRDTMWRANAYVVTSRYETFSIVLIEALATGLPVISTRCGGPADIVTQDVVGELTAVNAPGELSLAMTRIFETETRHTTTKNALLRRKHIVDNFSETAFCDKITRCYKRTISSIE